MRPLRPTLLAICCVLLCMNTVGCSSSASRETARTVATFRFVDVAGTRLRVRSIGSPKARQTLVLVHGGPGLSLESLGNLDALAGVDRRLVSYDQRGTGQSDQPTDGDYGPEAQLRDLDGVRVWAGAKRIDLLGQSWGGLLAAAYTAKHPDVVRSLVLLDAAPLDWAAFLDGQQRFSTRERALRVQGVVPAVLPPDDGDSCLPSLLARIPVYLANERDPVPAFATTCRASTSRATFAAFQSPSAQEELTRLAVALGAYRGRALVIMGRNDPFGLGWLERSVELLGGAQIEQLVVERSGHLSSLERPEVVLPEMNTWLTAGG